MMPRWYREQYYRHKLSHVLNSPLSDIRDVKAAELAIKNKLNEDESKNRLTIAQKAQELKKLL